MIECFRGLDVITKRHKCRLLRPSSNVKDNPRLWWKYAIKCHGYNFQSYKEKLQKAHDNLHYIRIYKKSIQNPNENLTLEDKQFKTDFEMETDLDELKILREICLMQAENSMALKLKEKDTVTTNQGRSMLFHWFPQWWGWYGNSSQTSTTNNDTNLPLSSSSLSDSVIINENETTLEDEILNALEDSVDTNSNNSLLKRDVVFGKFDFSLKSGLFDVCSELQTSNNGSGLGYESKSIVITMLQMHFDELKLNIETRPRSGSHLIGLSLGSVCVKDLITKNTEFPNLIKPQIKDDMTTLGGNFSSFYHKNQKLKASLQNSSVTGADDLKKNTLEPWFQLQYEKKPLAYNTDYRLVIKTQSLDVVYNIGPLKWLIDFITKPILIDTIKQQKLEAMKYTTKMKLIKNWKNILDGDLGQRKSWSLEINISAPQIIFVENFCSKNTSIVLVDFGRFQLLKNATQNCIRQQKDTKSGGVIKTKFASTAGIEDTTISPTTAATIMKTSSSSSSMLSCIQKEENSEIEEDEEEDAFMTPCSTPPGSEISISDSPTTATMRSTMATDSQILIDDNNSNIVINKDTGLEDAFHDRIYDKYTIDLTDLQVLVCKSKERWGWASNKGTSALHVLDRFNISLHLQRRVVHTTDPEYPSLTLYGTLPKLVAHLNENKIAAITDILDIITSSSVSSNSKDDTNSSNNADNLNETKSKQSENVIETDQERNKNNDDDEDDDKTVEGDSINHEQQLILLQFVIDQMSLELQSRGRSVAELQVSGVRAGLTKRPYEMNVSLSVHGLLLADAIQSFGQDFELLVASHRHVG